MLLRKEREGGEPERREGKGKERNDKRREGDELVAVATSGMLTQFIEDDTACWETAGSMFGPRLRFSRSENANPLVGARLKGYLLLGVRRLDRLICKDLVNDVC